MTLQEQIKELEETRKQIDEVIRKRFCYSSEELLDNFDKALSIIKKQEEIIKKYEKLALDLIDEIECGTANDYSLLRQACELTGKKSELL